MVKLKVGVSREELEEAKIRQFFRKFGDIVEFEAELRNKCFITFKYAESAAIVDREGFQRVLHQRAARYNKE